MSKLNRNQIPNQIHLGENDIPKFWYNIAADLTNAPVPPLNPATHQPASASDFDAIFPPDLIAQEMSQERYIEIPQEVRELYKMYRPSPLIRAYRLEKALGTPARIYFKYEGNSPSGSHKFNSAIPQVYYNKIAGKKRIATETAAGQWGTALSIATKFFGLDCTVYMVRVSYEQKPYRKSLMQVYGATVIPSPSQLTNAGRSVLKEDPDNRGSLAIAISEAVEDAAGHSDTNYALGSVLNHVVLHQTIIGQEAKLQMEMVDEYPDIVIGCCGGGSNFSGIAFPFAQDKMTKGSKVVLRAVEPTACPTLTRGEFLYDFGDEAHLTPMLKMYTLGNKFMPQGIHAGGLRYHGDNAILSQLVNEGVIEAVAKNQTNVFEAAMLFAQTEAILPAPESSHAICEAIDEAKRCKATGEEKVILFCLSGHGNFDLAAYDNYLSGAMMDVALTDADIKEGLKSVPTV